MGFDTKIMAICGLAMNLGEQIGILSAILEIQEDCHLKSILVVITASSIPKNKGLDTKTMTLCGLEKKLEGKMGILETILKNCPIKFKL